MQRHDIDQRGVDDLLKRARSKLGSAETFII